MYIKYISNIIILLYLFQIILVDISFVKVQNYKSSHKNLNSKLNASHFESNYILRTILLVPKVAKNGNRVIVMCFHSLCVFFIKDSKHCRCSTLSKIMAQGLSF